MGTLVGFLDSRQNECDLASEWMNPESEVLSLFLQSKSVSGKALAAGSSTHSQYGIAGSLVRGLGGLTQPRSPWVMSVVVVLTSLGSLHADDADAVRIIERRCIQCHDAADAKGALSLEVRDAALKGGDTGPSIVPENPEESLLWQQISEIGRAHV